MPRRRQTPTVALATNHYYDDHYHKAKGACRPRPQQINAKGAGPGLSGRSEPVLA